MKVKVVLHTGLKVRWFYFTLKTAPHEAFTPGFFLAITDLAFYFYIYLIDINAYELYVFTSPV